MATFQVLSGQYHDNTAGNVDENTGLPRATIYEQGDTFESNKPLDELFANKFRRLDGPTKSPKSRDASLDNSGRVMNKDLHARSKKELQRAGETGIEEPMDKEELNEIASDPKKAKKLKKKLRDQKNLNKTGFAIKAEDGKRRQSPDDEEEEMLEAGDEEEDIEDRKPGANKSKKQLKDELDEEEEDTEETEEEDEDSEEDEDEPIARKVKKKLKEKAKKGKKS